ncbi:actin-like ATPase domain-containing protein [Laetiporus sulphureus 93-53]|uniref:Actin-like ATPase domain-containing protein n=1 Tax=Laetiporus sulphureus 93-53 TaxID=1314785 RepID=A0A165G724_9APHY|nr:actin-like ATPase domain-containing protein [Laetiporus sulphureus 93-53]KZT09917.1 actin-like ATPase domain-containing protein [Laetiporus sulphureus 93-53]
MSSGTFRDSFIVILDTGRTTIRAGLGLHDLLRTPSVDILARVGLPRSFFAPSDANDNGDIAQGDPSITKAVIANAKVTDYLVGVQLDEALAGNEDVAIFWPFADGDVSDWEQAEALWKHVFFTRLPLRRSQMESPVLLSLPAGLSRATYERVCQMFFERFNVAGFGVVERPLAQFYSAVTASGQLSGVVVDIDREWTDITPISDGLIVQGARMQVRVGMNDCRRHLTRVLRGNQNVMGAVQEILQEEGKDPSEEAQLSVLEGLADQLWAEGQIKVLHEGEGGTLEDDLDGSNSGELNIAAIVVAGKEKAVIESGMKKKAAREKASAAEQARAREIEAKDLIEVKWRGKTVTVGKERHRYCEPLWDAGLRERKGKERQTANRRDVPELPLHIAVGEAVARTEVDQRAYIWQGLFVTGDITDHVKGLGAALQSRLSSFLLVSLDPSGNEVQPRSIHTLKIPDYFAEYREKGDGLASFLGSSIVAKISFGDSAGKNFVSKADYINMGPRAVLGMSPSLL